jgi:hypothetical protein
MFALQNKGTICSPSLNHRNPSTFQERGGGGDSSGPDVFEDVIQVYLNLSWRQIVELWGWEFMSTGWSNRRFSAVATCDTGAMCQFGD